jgi:hypothetical protein
MQIAFDPSIKVYDTKTEVYAFTIEYSRSEDPLDLLFQSDDKIKILLQHNSRWWIGELKGKKFFPYKFCSDGLSN